MIIRLSRFFQIKSLYLLTLGVFVPLWCIAHATAQTRPVVVIDAGHGGEEAGVQAGGIDEKDIALRAAFVLAETFVSRGYDVRLTRTGDYKVSIAERLEMAETAKAALFISLHFNGDDDTSKYGIEIYANLDDPLRTDLSSRVATTLRELDTPVVVETRPWGFIRSPTVPTLMLEAGFLTHPVERRLIVSAAHHHALADKIVDGVADYLDGQR